MRAPVSTCTRCATARRGRRHHPVQLPGDDPAVEGGPALACGNTFMLKPSERTRGRRTDGRVVRRGRLSSRRVPVVHGDKEAVNGSLSTRRSRPSPSWRSEWRNTSIRLRRPTARGCSARRGEEPHGRDARRRLDQAVDALIGAGYGSAGERCVAKRRRAGRRTTAERFRARLVERVNALRVGHSLDPKADYGPLVTEAALNRVHEYIAQGVMAGADIVVDGRERRSDDLQFGDDSLEGATSSAPRCSTTSQPICRSTPTRSSGRCCASSVPTTTKRRWRCRPSTNTATA